MDETLKRRLVGIGVISLLVLMVAWWLPDREDGQKRLNPETLPTETRVYDINELGKSDTQASQSAEADSVEVDEAAPAPDFEPDFGQALDKEAVVAKAEAGEESLDAGSSESEPAVEDIESEPAEVAKPAVKPAPVTTTASAEKPASDAKPQAKTEPEPQKTAKAEAATPAAQTAPEPTVGGEWLVQVGSYSKQANAESMRQKLAAKSYRVSVSSAQVGGTTYHRVRVGPYANKSDANAAADQLKKLLGQNVAVMSND